MKQIITTQSDLKIKQKSTANNEKMKFQFNLMHIKCNFPAIFGPYSVKFQFHAMDRIENTRTH
jgi:hypothetical protein